MVDKSRQNEAFDSLDERHRKAVILLFEDELTDEQIAKSVNRSRATLSKWKKDPLFQQAQQEYRRIALDSYVPDAIKHLNELALNSKSDMVQLQATQTILNMAGYGTVNSNVELDKAKVRKANAEADIAEARAKELEPESGADDNDGFIRALKNSARNVWGDDNEA
ncbi:phBC6A51 family helix-turn-helix protein [Pediococcus acidilactici]|uniref:phBC6A51 family helix-turn-helix protein n=1 Tax=Pediococcus acidilactici TaxID=1254 RepID=UPI00071AF3D3|nr:phBC6A51 family helix-turn-helix protein [Pediococcus acidilactici]KAF0342450.1 helix-turn-helix domain-containing protein [Pediococcus acidilactici]KAF0362175.1 helix-turn-helix domain-containing protein [Pediococcus acidilactici]KAF0365896.1 helix-turn-helix domain-containing protein [Pediococcus acidilactici]KAF0416783.1 helix-turn-helix domain-containing protein [Pediococcus acidilactici]KAF0420466.1 helix-turn-helix domain-containing protein [Pediococcus acidilactici]